MPVVLISNFLAVVVFYIAVSGAAVNSLRLWVLGMVILLFVRWVIWRLHSRQPFDNHNIHSRAIVIFVLAAIAGIAWGIAGVAFFSITAPLDNMVLILVFAALLSGGLVTMSGFLPIYFVFSVTLIAPMGFYLMFQSEHQFFVMGGSFLIYLLASLSMSINIERAITETFQLQNENALLIDELREQKDIAEKANLDKSRFLAAISHDLRQPMHAVGLFISALGPHVKPTGKVILDKSHSSIIALRSLFNGLLDVTRLDSGKIEAEIVPLDLEPFLARIVEGFMGQAEGKGLKLNLYNKNIFVNSDPLLLERVVRNLLSNAIQYTDQGVINLRCTATDSKVMIEVQDEGMGIPRIEQENIFSEYHQLNNQERDRSKGLGLGLAIVRRICKILEISLSLKSTPAQGSVFSLEMPIAERTSVGAQEIDQPTWNLTNQSIVVIDDEQDILDAMGQLLGMWGCAKILGKSTQEAMEQVRERSFVPSILIVDYRLRGETGLETIAQFRSEFNRTIPAILITGDTTSSLLKNDKLKETIFLHKPVSSAELRTAIFQLISH